MILDSKYFLRNKVKVKVTEVINSSNMAHARLIGSDEVNGSQSTFHIMNPWDAFRGSNGAGIFKTSPI